VPWPTRAERIKGLKLFIAKVDSKGITATLEGIRPLTPTAPIRGMGVNMVY
jgi:hypothetical protein